MATVVSFNDFRYGTVSERMRRRSDLEMYQKSAAVIENAVPMRTGGVRLRPGMVREADLTAIKAVRAIPFVISVREHYLVILSEKKVYIFGLSLSGAYEDVSGGGFPCDYTEAEIREVQHAQSYQRMVLAHMNHPPLVIEKSSLGGWSVGTIALDSTTDAYIYEYGDDGSEKKSAFSYDYNGLFTLNNFPSVVAYHANRLWFAASREHPYRLWASRPFEDFNFQIVEYYNYVDDTATVDQYMDAIAGASEASEVIKEPSSSGALDGEIWRMTKTVDASTGVVVSTNAIYQYSNTGEIGEILGHREYDEETDTWGDPIYDGKSFQMSFKYTKAVMLLDSTTTDACAMQLDTASDRDEAISWLASNGDYIFVGTASSEWAMPSTINALNRTINKLTSYGSASFLQSCYGVRNIFYVQSGGRLLRTISSEGGGISFSEPTYQCSDMLAAGVVEMAWQRVPEPRLYCVLKDGTMAVLSYDTDYGVTAWCIWKSELSFRSVAVIDDEDGQQVFAMASSKDGSVLLLRFEDGVFTDDGDNEFIARIRTNDIDSMNTMLYTKKSFRIAADSMGTRFKARMNRKSPAVAYDYSKKLVKLWNWTDPTDSGLYAEFESFPGEDMVLLAVMVETEVSD